MTELDELMKKAAIYHTIEIHRCSNSELSTELGRAIENKRLMPIIKGQAEVIKMLIKALEIYEKAICYGCYYESSTDENNLKSPNDYPEFDNLIADKALAEATRMIKELVEK